MQIGDKRKGIGSSERCQRAVYFLFLFSFFWPYDIDRLCLLLGLSLSSLLILPCVDVLFSEIPLSSILTLSCFLNCHPIILARCVGGAFYCCRNRAMGSQKQTGPVQRSLLRPLDLCKYSVRCPILSPQLAIVTFSFLFLPSRPTTGKASPNASVGQARISSCPFSVALSFLVSTQSPTH